MCGFATACDRPWCCVLQEREGKRRCEVFGREPFNTAARRRETTVKARKDSLNPSRSATQERRERDREASAVRFGLFGK